MIAAAANRPVAFFGVLAKPYKPILPAAPAEPSTLHTRGVKRLPVRVTRSYDIPANLRGKARHAWRNRELRRIKREAVHREHPSVISCLTKNMGRKRIFADYVRASNAAVSLSYDVRDERSRLCRPYQCRLGHWHIGGYPDFRWYLTGGVA